MPRKRKEADPQTIADVPALRSALQAEFQEWQRRHITEPGITSRVAQIDGQLSSGTMTIDDAVQFQRLLFVEMVASGAEDNAVRQRLALSLSEFQTLRKEVFGSIFSDEDRLVLRNVSLVAFNSTLEDIDRLIAEAKMIGGPVKFSTLTPLYKLKKEYLEARDNLLALALPQTQQINVTRQVSVSLEIAGTREQLADILDVESVAVPMLPPPDSDHDDTDSPFPVMELETDDGS